MFSEMSQGDMLNMSVISSQFEKNKGWTGANIAYNLALLWEESILLSSIGDDFEYDAIISSKVNLKYIHKQDMCHSASSIIISDNADNKMTVFHPGAMSHASSSKLEYVQESCSVWIVSANHIPTMLEHAKGMQEKKIPLFLDPAQQISQMTQEQLLELLLVWNYLIANNHEFTQILKKLGKSQLEIIEMFEIVVVSNGSNWLDLYQNWMKSEIPAIQTDDFDDTTWAWDALRAGILFWMVEGMDITTSCQIGTILASYSILASGSQHHHFSLWGVMEDMKNHYGVEIDLFNKRKY